jgi:hypothetical protein
MRRLIGVGVLLLLGGCDWLFGSSSPANTEKVRPGAERQVNATNTLPAARGAGYDASVAPVDENRGFRIGSSVQAKGGQKAQKEALEKEASERDAKAREERERAAREAALKKAQEGGDKGDKGGDKGGEKAGDKPGDTKPAVSTEAVPPAAPPTPVNTAPLAPPPDSTPPPPAPPKQ